MVISDLPNDLESEILFRVPAKCLTKLRRTCKRWYALFRDPSFIKKNMDKATRELILHSNYDVHSISVNLHGVDPSMEFTGKLGRLNDPRKLRISRVFHCHGLVLCTTIGNAGLVVWNPSTGERKWIKPRTCYRCDDSYALGYVNNKSSCDIHSYKILRICRYYNDQEIRVAEFEMYEFSSDSWRAIDDDITWGIFSDGVSLKGNTYWVGGEKETGYFLINFDFTTERFSRLPLPYQSFHPDDIGVLSVVGEEKLSLVNQNLHLYTSPIKMNVWMTNKFHEAKDLSWSDFLVVDYDKLVLSSTHVDSLISFVLDEEKKVMLCSETAMFNQNRMGIYIIGEGVHKYVYKESTKGSDLNWPLLISYVPNLVRIQENTPKITKKRKPKKAPIGGQLCKKC